MSGVQLFYLPNNYWWGVGIMLVKEESKSEVRFISLCSDTTFKYLYKNSKTRKWLNEIIKN